MKRKEKGERREERGDRRRRRRKRETAQRERKEKVLRIVDELLLNGHAQAGRRG
jgi:hypothetical protein